MSCTGHLSPSNSYGVPGPSSRPAGSTNTPSTGGGATSNSTSRSAGAAGGRSPRKKNHGCWMCHKSFDRPSTLRKVSSRLLPFDAYRTLSLPICPIIPHLAPICTMHVRDSSSRLRAVYFYDHGSILHCAHPFLISASPVHSASLPVCSSLHPPLHLGRCLHSPSSRDRASPPLQPGHSASLLPSFSLSVFVMPCYALVRR